jgi:O-antigen/teichoic acid export membrane protein
VSSAAPPEFALSATDAVDRRLRGRPRLLMETLGAKWLELSGQALLLLILPRLLGPDDFGEFAVAFALVSLASLGMGLGAPVAASRYIPRAAPGERLAVTRALVARVVRMRVPLLAALTLAAIPASWLVPGVSLGVALAVCGAAWFAVGTSVVAEIALGLGRTRMWNLRFPLENGLVLVAAVAGHAAFGGVGAIIGLPLAMAVTFALLTPAVARELRGAEPGAELPPGTLRFARLTSFTVLVFVAVTRAGPPLVSLLGGSSAQAGYAAIASGIAAAGSGVVGSMMVVQLPRLATLARSDPGRAEAEARRSGLLVTALAAVAAVVAAGVADPLIRLVLGHDFAGAVGPVSLALAAVPLTAVTSLAGVISSLRLRPERIAAAWGVGGGCFLAAAVPAISALDAEGAALALVAGVAAACLAATRLLGSRALGSADLAGLAGAAAVVGVGLAVGGL